MTPRYISPAGVPDTLEFKVRTNRPDGYGSGQELRRRPDGNPLLSPEGKRVAIPAPAPMSQATVVWEFVKSLGEWVPKSYFPEP